MRIFLAGIMQGSHLELRMHDQHYRQRLKRLLERHLPQADVYDPLADHQSSLQYDDQTARRVFLHHVDLCREVDVVIAFIPEASMGTAIEMWEARRAGQVVISISPLQHSWVVKFLSHHVYATLEDFEVAVASGLLRQQIETARASAQQDPA